ncbi:MAG: cell division protein CrgA [Acidimicrobiia bacterium]
MGSRYTPPKAKSERRSPAWLIALMISLLVAGLTVVVANQLGYLPGGNQARYLILGFALFLAGFLTTTQLR